MSISILKDSSLIEFLELTQELRSLCHRVLSSPSSDATQQARDRRTAMTFLTRLRQLNRSAQLQSRAAKQTTAEAKHELDRAHLGLQNLYYEHQHFLSEIAQCEDYAATYTTLDLVSEEDFLSAHPEQSSSDPHVLMLARIQAEGDERDRLEALRKELVGKKAALVEENKKRKDEMEAWDAEMLKFIESAGPIKEALMKY
ncbi:hypothetical protein YB2330_003816 [Saitoella coloradoensis]